MIYSLPDFISTYWYFLLGAAVICGVLSYRSKKICSNLKKTLIVVAVVFLAVAGYELITGNSIVDLPGSVDKKLSEGPADPEKGHRYYKGYEERYGEKPPE